MRKALLLLLLTIGSFSFTNLDAIRNFEQIYPNVIHSLDNTYVYPGDRHGQFEGDLVAYLSDGSYWKIHPKHRDIYMQWSGGDFVRIKVRTDFYWFKREHKFSLYNLNNGQSVNVMLVQHANLPFPLKIVSTDQYVKGYTMSFKTQIKIDEKGKPYETTVVENIPILRKVICLSDGSFWVIKDNFDDFTLGANVYVGAQGHPTKWYDFILISGNEREASWTYARPQK